MNQRLKLVYKENRQILDSIVGVEIKSAIEEQYFYEDKLDEESKGSLKLIFSNDEKIIFKCDIDAESLRIKKGDFTNKRALETDFKDGKYRWKEKEFLNKKKLQSLGQIVKSEIELLTFEKQEIQSGCRLSFQNGDFLHVWIIPSDNIFYGINQKPAYYKKEELKIDLK